ncbi:hypothetical protein T492DRAFT_850584 [Pavlovales sp. CCMP2436]|nr:hypothetical protein T492DRAFT_850584 [Pavlovales sp. CCMP2436]
MFLHGAVSETCVGQVPPGVGEVPPRHKGAGGFRQVGELRAWVNALNSFAADELASFARFPQVAIYFINMNMILMKYLVTIVTSKAIPGCARGPRASKQGEPGMRPWAEEGGYGGRGGEGLLQYGMGGIPLEDAAPRTAASDAGPRAPFKRPKMAPNPTVIYASWFDNGRCVLH